MPVKISDHDRPEHDHADDAPEQDPVLERPGNGEVAEDHGDDEDIVHRQRLLDRKAGQVLKPGLAAQLPPHPAAEHQGDGDIHAGQHQALANPDLMLILVEDAQIEHQEREHHAHKRQPHPRWLAQPVGQEKTHQVHRTPLV